MHKFVQSKKEGVKITKNIVFGNVEFNECNYYDIFVGFLLILNIVLYMQLRYAFVWYLSHTAAVSR